VLGDLVAERERAALGEDPDGAGVRTLVFE